MSKARAKGTSGENEIVRLLGSAGFPLADPEDPTSQGVKRFEGGYESHDIQGVGDWVIEVKFRKRWMLMSWVRRIRKRAFLPSRVHSAAHSAQSDEILLPAGEKPWVIFCIHGDRRTEEGREVGRVAVMDAEVAADLIYHWENG